MEKVLIHEFKLPISRNQLNEVIIKNQFKNTTGRNPGEEDITKHNRKGIQGDWKNYFTPEITKLFKEKYGEHLVSTGYEKNINW